MKKNQIRPEKYLRNSILYFIIGIGSTFFGAPIYIPIFFSVFSIIFFLIYLSITGVIDKWKNYLLIRKDRKEYLKLKSYEKNKIQATKEIDYKKLLEQYSYLSLEAKNSIALIFEEIKKSFSSIYDKYEDIDIYYTDVLIKMLNDVKDFETIDQIQLLFSKNYFLKIMRENFDGIIDELEEYINSNKSKFGYKKYLEILESIAENVSENNYIKINTAMCQDIKDLEIEKSIFSDTDVSGEIEYITNILVAHSTICQLVFVSKKMTELDDDDEFKKIIVRMIGEVKDQQIIFDKLLPIYEEFYKDKLGNVNKYLFNFAFYNFCYASRDKKIENKINKIDTGEYKNISSLSNINSIIKLLSNDLMKSNIKEHEIPFYIISLCSNVMDNSDLSLCFKSLQKVYDWYDIYINKLKKETMEQERNRLLKGDFSKEKDARALKYNLLDVKTGRDFEIYLKDLFKTLNYKVKLNGKSGDQGGDLIVSKNNITYVVQAKYYSKKLDNTPVQEVIGAIRFYNADRGVVITNSSFTSGAKSLAKSNKIILIDGNDLKKMAGYIYDDLDNDFLEYFDI